MAVAMTNGTMDMAVDDTAVGIRVDNFAAVCIVMYIPRALLRPA